MRIDMEFVAELCAGSYVLLYISYVPTPAIKVAQDYPLFIQPFLSRHPTCWSAPELGASSEGTQRKKELEHPVRVSTS